MDLDLVGFSPGAYLAPVVDWLNANFHPFFDMVTKVIEAVLGGLEATLLYLPFYAVILIAMAFAAVVVNVRVAVTSAIALTFCFLAGLWEASMQTLALVTVSVCISVLIAFPLGILASRYRMFAAAIRPVLDIMQTVPPWVYLIPAVMIFTLGRVPAIIATIVYGVPPMLRLTTLWAPRPAPSCSRSKSPQRRQHFSWGSISAFSYHSPSSFSQVLSVLAG